MTVTINGTGTGCFTDASGNVGVGTATPSTRLHTVQASNGATVRPLYVDNSAVSGTSQAGIAFSNGGAVKASINAAVLDNDFMTFCVGGSGNTERARIDASGNLLVGTTSSSETSFGARLYGSDGRISSTKPESTNAASTFVVYSTGAAAYRFYVGMGGTVFATNTTISGISDQRFKENVRDLDVGLDAILALKPRKFDWKEGKGKDIKGDRGFIAQEFEQVFPDLVDEWADPAPDGEEPYKSVRADLIPVLVKAIQELKAQNDELKARVEALEAK